MASNDPRFSIGSVADVRAGAPAIDQGLRAFMLAVYNHMALGVAITGAVALGAFMMAVNQVDGQIVGLTGFGQLIFQSPLKWVVILSPLAIVLWMSFGQDKMTSSTARDAVLPLRGAGRPVACRPCSSSTPAARSRGSSSSRRRASAR